MAIAPTRKYRVCEMPPWPHRWGWPYLYNRIVERFHDPNAPDLFTTSLEHDLHVIAALPAGQQFVAITHHPWAIPRDRLPRQWQPAPTAHEVINLPHYRHVEQRCRCLLTLSAPVRDQLRTKTTARVESLHLAIPRLTKRFDPAAFLAAPRKRLAQIGSWLRNFQAFLDVKIPTDWYKAWVFNENTSFAKEIAGELNTTGVDLVDTLSLVDYDRYLTSSVVFTNFYATAANNLITECIISCTPVIVNRLPEVVDYLGRDYPLFYDTLDEAETLMTSDAIVAGHHYLANLDKTNHDPNTFLKRLTEFIG